MSLVVSRRDLDFLFYEVFGREDVLKAPRYADYDRETLAAILDTAQAIAEEEFAPLAAELDANEPKFVDGKVEISCACKPVGRAKYFLLGELSWPPLLFGE